MACSSWTGQANGRSKNISWLSGMTRIQFHLYQSYFSQNVIATVFSRQIRQAGESKRHVFPGTKFSRSRLAGTRKTTPSTVSLHDAIVFDDVKRKLGPFCSDNGRETMLAEGSIAEEETATKRERKRKTGTIEKSG